MKSIRRLQQLATWQALKTAVEQYRDLYEQVVQAAPASLRPHIVAVAVRDDTLHVWLDSAVWATRLHQSQQQLLDALPIEQGFRATRIRTHVRPVEAPPERPVRRARPPSEAIIDQLDQLADSLSDRKLEEQMKRLTRTLRQCRRSEDG